MKSVIFAAAMLALGGTAYAGCCDLDEMDACVRNPTSGACQMYRRMDQMENERRQKQMQRFQNAQRCPSYLNRCLW